MKLLHINVRLMEGGAARIAMSLHKQALKLGWSSVFAYGYGPGAKPNPLEADITGAMRLTNRPRAIANYAGHKIVGIDFFSGNLKARQRIEEKIRCSDIVHLHAIHSYFISYRWLLETLLKHRQKVVWTLHDDWVTTGRCASAGNCTQWLQGCGDCQNRGFYPGAYIDFSKREALVKRRIIQEMGNYLTFVAIAKNVENRARKIYKQQEIVIIPNGVDELYEDAAKKLNGQFLPRKNVKTQALVIGVDLSSPQKMNLNLINKVINDNNCEITTIGNNSPFKGGNVRNLGEIRDRQILANSYAQADVVIFTSTVDPFGLVMAESLCVGTPVLAIDSIAAREVLGMVRGRPVDAKELIERIRNKKFLDLYNANSREELQENSLRMFSCKTMLDKYFNLYQRVYSEK